MIIEDFTIQESRLAWSSPDPVSWVFVDGVYRYGPLNLGAGDKSIPFTIGKLSSRVVEIHDVEDASIVVRSTIIKKKDKPTITWDSVEGSAKYAVYHKLLGGSFVLLKTISHSNVLRYKLKISLPEGLNLIRVDSVDNYGNQSTREEWSYFNSPYPNPATSLTITEGSASGLFDFVINE